MIIKDLSLADFRSYKQEVFEFGDGVNIVVGPNASGKTNLLEAVLVLCTGRSYRARDADMIMFSQPWARIESDTSEGKRMATIERGEPTKKKFVIAGKSYGRLSLNKSVPVVVFEPEHLRLLNGQPARRRDYLDDLLEQTVTGYGRLRREYKRTLAQRNALLKNLSYSDDPQLFAWNVRLSQTGGKITQYRSELVQAISQQLQDLYNQLAATDGQVSLVYETDAPADNYSTEVLKLLSKNINQDKLRGFTTNGPHRHDLVISLNGHPAALSASRGETRTLLLALKILELKMLEANRNQKPLLLLDDVFSELDGARRKALTQFLADYQTFITTTDADIVVQHFMDNCTIIPIQKV